MSFYRPLNSTYKLPGRVLLVVSIVPPPLRGSHDRTQPVVSVGNVAQLAADLLIASLKLDRVGVFDPKHLVPVVGAREDGTVGLTTPIERKSPLQPVEMSRRVILGQYSARRAARSRSSSNVPPCSRWVGASRQCFSPVIISGSRSSNSSPTRSSSSSAILAYRQWSSWEGLTRLIEQTRKCCQYTRISGPSSHWQFSHSTPTTFIQPPVSPPLEGGPLASLADLPIPPYSSPLSRDLRSEGSSWLVPFIPGGGIAHRLLSSIPNSWQIPTVCLLQYAMEGDNRPDAQLLATVAAKALGNTTVISTWMQPKAWAHGLFGTPHDQTLYG